MWAVAITEPAVKALTMLATTNDIETAMAVFCTVRRKICDEVDLPQKEQLCKIEGCEEVPQQAAGAEQQQGYQSAQGTTSTERQDVDTQAHTQQLAPEQQREPNRGVDVQQQVPNTTTQQRSGVERKSKDEILKEFEEIMREYGDL